MIAMLRGILADKQPAAIVVDVAGVGYELAVPMSTFCNLPDVGHEVKLQVQMVVREDAILLYGFLTREEKAAFQALVKVSGIGAKIALAVLSGMSVSDLSGAVSRGESDLLTRVPGIGKKTAARLVLELKGKLGPELEGAAAAASGASSGIQADIVAALVALGYTEREAAAAVRNVPAGATVEEGIRMVLRARN